MKEFILRTTQGNIPISKIIMGTTYFDTDTGKELTYQFLDYYYAQGGRTIDTARVYGQSKPEGVSKSEEIIGQWLKDRGLREEITLITKGAHPPLDDMYHSRVTAKDIAQDIKDSLACLQVDCIDIYFLHRDHPEADVLAVMQALTTAVREGKIQAFGASNWSAQRMLAANALAQEHNLEPFTIAEIQWSLAVCDAESWGDDTLIFMTDQAYGTFQEAGIPVLAFSSQAKGLFSQYIAGGIDAVKPKAKRFLNDKNVARIKAVAELSQKKGRTPAQITLAYITDNPLEAGAIIGASTMEQLEDSLQATNFTLTPEEIKGLTAI